MPEPSRRVQRAARKLADQQTGRLADAARAPLIVASVASVTAGASTDGRAVVTVTYRGEEVTVAGYNRGQAYAVGDRVRCSFVDSQLFIDYILGGFPPEQ